jgi:hypothetical protein
MRGEWTIHFLRLFLLYAVGALLVGIIGLVVISFIAEPAILLGFLVGVLITLLILVLRPDLSALISFVRHRVHYTRGF